MFLIGRIVRSNRCKCPLTLRTTSMDGKILRGRPFGTIRDAFLENAKFAVLEADAKGRIGDWAGCAVDVSKWERKVNNREQRQRG